MPLSAGRAGTGGTARFNRGDADPIDASAKCAATDWVSLVVGVEFVGVIVAWLAGGADVGIADVTVRGGGRGGGGRGGRVRSEPSVFARSRWCGDEGEVRKCDSGGKVGIGALMGLSVLVGGMELRTVMSGADTWRSCRRLCERDTTGGSFDAII